MLEQRKAMHKCIGSRSAVKDHYPTFELESRRLLQRLLDSPDDLFNQISVQVPILLHPHRGGRSLLISLFTVGLRQ